MSAKNNSYRPPPLKKPKKTGFFQVKETWMHDFFCLVSKTATIVPPRAEKISLQNAELTRRKVVFPWRASAVDVLKVLENVYPKLQQSGGFELFRSRSPASMLSLISPSASGYSVPFLRDAAGLLARHWLTSGCCKKFCQWIRPWRRQNRYMVPANRLSISKVIPKNCPYRRDKYSNFFNTAKQYKLIGFVLHDLTSNMLESVVIFVACRINTRRITISFGMYCVAFFS